MRFNPILLITALVLVSFHSSAQKQTVSSPDESRYRLQLRNGTFLPQRNITTAKIDSLNQKTSKVNGVSFTVIQFETIPDASQRRQLQQAGIELLDYIPGNAYTASVKGALSLPLLTQVKARAVITLTPEQKMEPSLAQGIFPAHAVKTPGTIDVWISFPKTFSYETVVQELKTKNFDIVTITWKDYRVLGLRVATTRLNELAALPFIEYVEAAPKEDEKLNNKSRTNSRANVLQSTLPGGRNLQGQGVVIGIGDDSDPTSHIDYAQRIINRTSSIGGAHGVHVIGIAAGAGIIEEKYSGAAPAATVVAQAYSGILFNAPAYLQDYNMVITNNSYGNVEDDCATFGVYDLYSRVMDLQMLQMPHLQHVFAAGNSGAYNCPPFLPGFGNVLGGYQTAKNIISVGAAIETREIHPASSKGPVRDGRIKPEITAQGVYVVSTWPTNRYSYNSGTSMAAPAVSGGLALLYQRYRQLHSNADPSNGLMKALLCNGATDMGNTGPDFSYGFGWINLLRSVKMLEQNNYFSDSVASSVTNTHSITIPSGANISQLKVMLYWNDPAAAVLASQALVNDLDLEVTDPGSIIHYPLVPDGAPTHANYPDTTGPDHINNIEQVVIDNPGAGTYSFAVKGTNVPGLPRQPYFVVFDTVAVSTTLTYPIGGERFSYGDSVYVSWDSYGNDANDFTVSYFDGSVWKDSVVAANLRQFKWFPTNVITDQARIRITHNGTGLQSESQNITILGIPIDSLAAVQCEGYIATKWNTIPGATDYEVMILRGNDMVPVGTTTDTVYTISGLSKDSVYWVTVRARLNGSPGRRATAISRQPNSGTCTGTISDNDLKMEAILAPVSGRKLTSTELAAANAVSIRIKNLDNTATTGNVFVAYKIDANPWVRDTIIAPGIAGGATYDHTFSTTADLSATGVYSLVTSLSYIGDVVTANDTLAKTVKQLDNPFINLATDFLDDMETATTQSYYSPQTGLDGLDRYDFISNTTYGRLRSFVNTGISYSGSKALTLDADRYNPGGTADSLKGTFNLQGYSNTANDIRLDFMYKHHAQVPNAANKVWIRGNDTQPWIQVYDLYANQGKAGVYKKSTSIEVSDVLAANSQPFSSSFQVRWGQWGQILTADNESGAGYTFDDVHLYEVTDDIQMISIDTPVVASCGLNNVTPVRVTVRNSSNNTVTSIPVFFKVDGNSAVGETIASIGPNATFTYTFTATADMSAAGNHTLTTWVRLTTDTYRDNDSMTTSLYNSPIITSFPYLQNFESGAGSWYSAGENSSWQYGTPASSKINRAASGSKAWKTSLAGNYNDLELSYLYSPCFDLTGMTNPSLSISVALDLEDCGAGGLCDGAYVEYSPDGINWSRLGTSATGTNWYNRNYSGNQVWSIRNYTRWHVATIPLPTGFTRLRLRFVMASDPYVSFEGIAVDDIHIYDNTNGIYTGPPSTSSSVTQATVNGTNWINFTDGGKLIASINPNGQDLGSTDAQAYIYPGAVRVNTSQYYHNRNITIKPTNVNLADSATVRFYFLDSETEALINATGCSTCSKPASAYELGVSKYSDANDALENGTLADDITGSWLYINAGKAVKVPFDKGYYAEFKIKDFSEFWLNNGGINNNQTLPAELISFTATKQSTGNVITAWTTASENNTAVYEVELAKGNEEYRQNHFIRIGQVASHGNSTTEQYYQLTDAENNKSGVRYYRLKIIDNDGHFTYSAIRPVVFNDEVKWQVYPNPSTGLFNFIYQAESNESIGIKLYDVNGKQVQQSKMTADGFVQKSTIDLRESKYAPGLYLLEITAGDVKKVFRLIKQ